MQLSWVLLGAIVVLGCAKNSFVDGQTTEEAASAYLQWYDAERSRLWTKNAEASWAYNTNLTTHNRDQATAVSLEVSEFNKVQAQNASSYTLAEITDPLIKKQLELIMDIGISGYSEEGLKKINDLSAEMEETYSSARWCRDTGCLSLEPDLTNIISTSRDYDELRDAWKGWRDVSGRLMREKYEQFVQLLNEAITEEGRYSDMGEYYRSWYETDTFEADLVALFDDLKPLYENLHAYVRRKLREHYGADKFPVTGHIPAHLLGNMWAQSWNNIYDLVEPYPEAGRTDITKAMAEQNYTITQMYRLSEEFFTSMGMQPMPESFWRNSMLEKPTDGREVVCHASAWDFYNGTDFRIKQCTTRTEDQLITVHHEMGHVQYYLEYQNLPAIFRRGANPGFHEGVADIVTHSFQTPEHLQKVGLLDELPQGEKGDINFQLQMALSAVAFLPFGYLIDQWRWSVFRGDTTPSNYNQEWWKLRRQYQGVSPPVDVERSENDFDPGAKYHVPANVPYIRYFVSHVIQFQWHKALCELIGQAGTLHRCDIYNSTVAGDRLKAMLQMGRSQPWGEAMKVMTRGTSGYTDKMSVQPLLEFFKPLHDWLVDNNSENDEVPGWTDIVTNTNGAETVRGLKLTAMFVVQIVVLLLWF